MNNLMHVSGGLQLLVAGLCFAIAYFVGLKLGAKYLKSTLWPSILAILLACVVRGISAPLSIEAITAVSVLHVAVGCLTVLLLRSTVADSDDSGRK
ncbi:MAG TPA: hypothetical protein V6D22_07795 [Candidatus Obscuribacterales bacterium]